MQADIGSIVNTVANVTVATVAVWAVLMSMKVSREQLAFQARSELTGMERDQLIRIVDVLAEPFDAATDFTIAIAWLRPITPTIDQIADQIRTLQPALHRFTEVTTAALYVLASSRESRFPRGERDRTLESFRDMINDTIRKYGALLEFVSSTLPDLEAFGASKEHKEAAEARTVLRRGTCNLIAFMNHPNEWNRSITRVPGSPTGS